MEPKTSWLVPTIEDRNLRREVEAAITTARKVSIASILACLPFYVHTYGWWIVPVGVAYLLFALHCDRQRMRDRNTTAWMFALTIVTQIMFAGAAAATGGPQSPALIWMVVSMVPLSARYGRTGTIVAALASLVCLTAGALSHGIDALVASPGIFGMTLSSGIGCLAYGVAMRQSENRQRHAAVVDPLTGLLNRSKLGDRFEEVRQLAVAREQSVAMLVCDLDHFKAVNDQHGHAVGDRVLIAAADELRRVLRGQELIYRVGGEEFVVILPDSGVAVATAVAERIREAIAGAQAGGVTVTVSTGAAVASGSDLQYDALFQAADAALYEAKRRGRDRTVVVELLGGVASESGVGDDDVVHAA